MLNHLKAHLVGKVIILGIGNTLRSDDGAGAILAARIKDEVPFLVWDVGVSPENYLGKIEKEKPDTIVIIDAVDFGGRPGEFRVLEAQDLKTTNLFSTHNASISLMINYLQNNLKVDIIILIIQPKSIAFGDSLSPEINQTLNKLENWFYEAGKEKG
jgi:hydrogenase 3 maturation protease